MLKRKMIKNFTWPLKTASREIEVTRLYPEFMMELPDAERGIHELDATICIGCGSCARVCPNSCIEMVHFKFGNPLKNKKMQFPQIDYGRCMFCGLCVDECPVECLKSQCVVLVVDGCVSRIKPAESLIRIPVYRQAEQEKDGN